MHRRQFFRLLSGKAAVAMGLGLAGCAYPVGNRGYGVSGYPDTNYDYDYYPDVDVYFHIYTGFYYYRDDGRWNRSRRLPRHYRLEPRRRRRLSIREQRPYDRNREHRRQYHQGGSPQGGATDGKRTRRGGDPNAERTPRDRRRRQADDDARRAGRRAPAEVEPRSGQDRARHPAPDPKPRVRPREERQVERRETVGESGDAEPLRDGDREGRDGVEGERRKRWQDHE